MQTRLILADTYELRRREIKLKFQMETLKRGEFIKMVEAGVLNECYFAKHISNSCSGKPNCCRKRTRG